MWIDGARLVLVYVGGSASGRAVELLIRVAVSGGVVPGPGVDGACCRLGADVAELPSSLAGAAGDGGPVWGFLGLVCGRYGGADCVRVVAVGNQGCGDPGEGCGVLGDDVDLDAAERRIDGWQARIEERARRARELSQRLAAVSVTARSGDGLVEVTVGSSGVVTDLRLDEEIRRHPAGRTAGEILATIRAAQAALGARAGEIAVETLGADSEAARAVVVSYANRFGSSGDDGDG